MNNLILLGIFNNPVTCAFDKDYTCRDATIEILLMLLIAALLGFLLRHFLGYTRKKEIIRDNSSSNVNGSAEYKALLNENAKLKADLENCQKGSKMNLTGGGNVSTSNNLKSSDNKKSSKSKTTKTPPPAAKAKSGGGSSKKDDLKVVEGIGPAIEKLLNNANIFTYEELASAKIADLDKILDDAGPRFRVHVPETWTDQAKLLRDGKMEEFQKLTEELKGGRRK